MAVKLVTRFFTFSSPDKIDNRMHNYPKKFNLKKGFLFLIGACLLTSCSIEIENHGKRLETNLLDKIVLGSTKKEQVLTILGPPSTENDFGNKAWVYIASNNKQTAFLKNDLAACCRSDKFKKCNTCAQLFRIASSICKKMKLMSE